MPEKLRFEPQDTLTGHDFAFRQNHEMSSAQANETFIVDARFNRVLGKAGETLAFAKMQFKVEPEVQAKREAQSSHWDGIVGKLSQNQEVKAWEQKRKLTDRLPPDDPAKEQQMQELLNEYNNSPAIREFVAAAEKSSAAMSLSSSYDSIAESTSHLFAERKNMESPTAAGDRSLLTRAVASYEVEQLLQLGVCAEEKYGLDDQGQLFGISVQCDGVGVKTQRGTTPFGETQTCFLDTNYRDPKIQKGLHDLEVLDYITGQIDRHCGNIFIEPTSGKVTGIDNDASFPEIPRDEMLDRSPALCNKAVQGMPRMMHKDTADKIAAMDPEELRAKLRAVTPPNGGDGLSEAEIEGAVQRLKDLQEAIKNARLGQGGLEIVNEFNDDTYDRALEDQKNSPRVQGVIPRTSYIGAIEMQKQSIQEIISAGDSKHAFYKPKPDTPHKAKINPEYAAYLSMPAAEQQDYRTLQAALDKQEEKLAEIRRDMAKLEHPGMKERLTSLKHGGLDGARQHLLKQEHHLVKEMNARRNGLISMTARYLPTDEASPPVNGQQNPVQVSPPRSIHVNEALASQVKRIDPPEPSKVPKTKLNFAKGNDDAAAPMPEEKAGEAKLSVAAQLRRSENGQAHANHDHPQSVGSKIHPAEKVDPKPVAHERSGTSHAHHT